MVVCGRGSTHTHTHAHTHTQQHTHTHTTHTQVDVREDEEQDIKLRECIDLLLAAGYFRARIKGLSPFDKVHNYLCVVLLTGIGISIH